MRAFTWRKLVGTLIAAVLAAAGAVAVATPAQAAWGSQVHFVLNTNVNGHAVGYASGWVQFETDGNTFRYEVTVCRQSGYATPWMNLYVNAPSWGTGHGTYVANITPAYTGFASGSPCYSSVGTATGQYSYPNVSNVRFLLVGGTLDYQNGYATDEDYNRINNPY